MRHGLLDAARYEIETDYLMFMPPGITFLRVGRSGSGVAAAGGAICGGGAQARVNGEAMGMDRQTFEAELKRDGYDIITNTTPGAKVNPEHSHPFDVRAMVLKGAITLNRDGEARPTSPARVFDHAARLPALRELRRRKARWSCSAARSDAATSGDR